MLKENGWREGWKHTHTRTHMRILKVGACEMREEASPPPTLPSVFSKAPKREFRNNFAISKFPTLHMQSTVSF